MPKPLRRDFVAASVGLTFPRQHKNLGALHDWLVDEEGISSQEKVIALTNYQQGRFGRLPTHILLVTTHRVAYTHDTGLRSVPLSDLDTSRIGLKAGAVNGEITLVMRTGEELNFPRGISLAMQEVAAAIQQYARNAHFLEVNSSDLAPSNRPPDRSGNLWSGHGDDVIRFNSTVEGLQLFEIRGGGPMEALCIWALSATYSPQELLVNAAEAYHGVCVAGAYGPVGGLQVNTGGAWSIEPIEAESLPILVGTFTGVGDSATFLREGLKVLEAPLVLRMQAASPDAITVWAYGATPALLVNTIGEYEGTIVVPEGTQFLAIGCKLNWSLTQSSLSI